jgi:1-hydroxycarotenoid 3,4-desaturase
LASRDSIVVVGAGIGGLSCAIDLARQGFEVTVIERAARPGGKMREVEVGGARLDAGPTVMTLRWIFDELFAAAGANLDAHLTLEPLDVLARHAWRSGETLDLYSDFDRSCDAVAAFAGPAEAAGFRRFSEEARRVYETLLDTFLTAQQTTAMGLAGRIGLGRANALMGLRPFETLWRALGDHFRDPRLRQLFGRYATYCGASPFAAPATLMLIAHVEQAGVWRVEGGMQRLADALETLAMAQGVVFRYVAEAARITVAGGRADGVILADGERLDADAVVVNAGSAAIAAGLFGREVAGAVAPVKPSARSLSALTWALNAPTEGFPLSRHNVFFSDDYAAEFDDILARGRLPRDPTIYVCAQDRGGAGEDPQGPERLLVLVNAPADGDQRPLDEQELAACQRTVFDHLARCGLTLQPGPAPGLITTPTGFHHLFPGTGGALYGPATHGWSAAFERPGARTRTPGLYLAGGGAHPGAGVPMAALSGRLAAQALSADRASTRPFRRAAMPGGMSTP